VTNINAFFIGLLIGTVFTSYLKVRKTKKLEEQVEDLSFQVSAQEKVKNIEVREYEKNAQIWKDRYIREKKRRLNQ